MQDIVNTTALVTGGGSGIGRALCLELARLSAQVAITDHSPDRANATRDACLELGSVNPDHLLALRTDLTSRASLSETAQAVHERFGPVELLFANTGVTPPQGHAIGD